MASSTDRGSSARLCTVCLDLVLDDNSRGKAELICGHLFHLDCIGSEFNYRGEMRCPNCRVIENGEWLLPDDEFDDDDPSLNVVNRRLQLHIYLHDVRDNISRGQLAGQQSTLPIVAPTVHYHEHTVFLPSPPPPLHPLALGGNTTRVSEDPLSATTLPRVFGGPQGSDSTRRSRIERVVLQDRSNVEEVRSYYHSSSYQQTSSSPQTVDATLVHERRIQNILVPTNMARFESPSTYQLNDENRDPSTELRLNSGLSEEQIACVFEEQQHETREHLDDGTDGES